MQNILDKTDKSQAPTPTGGMSSKTPKYNWSQLGSMGEFRMISKRMLNIDGVYQRKEVSKAKVMKIAAEFDWTLFGTLSVADRGMDGLWVINGGHRIRATFYREEIDLVPCMVFVSTGIKQESQVFIDGQTQVTNVASIDLFRAAIAAENDVALATQAILSKLGITVIKTAINANQLKCIGAVVNAVKINRNAAEYCLALAQRLTDSGGIQSAVFRGLFEIAKRSDLHLKTLQSSEQKLMTIGQQGLIMRINQKKIVMGKGGSTIEGIAILDEINKGKRNKLAM